MGEDEEKGTPAHPHTLAPSRVVPVRVVKEWRQWMGEDEWKGTPAHTHPHILAPSPLHAGDPGRRGEAQGLYLRYRPLHRLSLVQLVG